MAVCLGYRWPLYGSICPQVHCKHLPWHLHQDHVKQIIIPTSDDLVFVAASIHRVLYLVSLCGSILWILRPFEWHSCMKGGVFPSQTGRPRLIVISGNDGMSITIPSSRWLQPRRWIKCGNRHRYYWPQGWTQKVSVWYLGVCRESLSQ